MSFQTDIASDVQKAELGSIIYLYELDLSDIGSNQLLYFTPAINEDYTPVEFQGKQYVPIEMETDGWETSAGQQLPRPHIRVSNATMSFLGHVIAFEDMVGAKLKRRRTLKKYLDGEPESNYNAEFAVDIFIVQQKTQHTKKMIEFELAAYMDFEGTKIPKRQIIRDYCTHSYRIWDTGIMDFNYEFASCPYGNPDVPVSGGGSGDGFYTFNRFGEYTSTRSDDQCGKRLSDCEQRFAGQRAEGTGPYIQNTEPGSPSNGDYWLYTGSSILTTGGGQSITPNVWYRFVSSSNSWRILKPIKIPTRAFPGVTRFRS